MNRWRIAGLVVLALLAASLFLWRFLVPQAPPAAPPPPAREVFQASKLLRLEVVSAEGAIDRGGDAAWLAPELRHLLNRARLRLAPAASTADAFTLRVSVGADADYAALALIAPDHVIERQTDVLLASDTRLGVLKALAAGLLPLLSVAEPADWPGLIGTDDERAYELYLSGMMDLLGPASEGFTRPSAVANRTRAVERLESLTRNHPRFARARAALAVGYLSLGGQDEASLAQLAKTSAERALALEEIAEARAALGLVHLRRSEWIAAREQFERALALDANSAPALEGSGCLLIDAGHFAAARAVLAQALMLQPGNVGASECLAYADTKRGEASPLLAPNAATDPAAGVQALAAILAGDVEFARQSLHSSLSARDFSDWADPLLQAAGDRRRIPAALQAITRAANEGRIDRWTEILCGTALRQTEFVFNRLARLQRQRASLPLRLLWLPQTDFLRRHSRFEQIVSAAGLPAFWQEHGIPDACASEPMIYGCKFRAQAHRRHISGNSGADHRVFESRPEHDAPSGLRELAALRL